MENLKVYVDSKYDLGDIVIFNDKRDNPLSPRVSIGIIYIYNIEAKLNKATNCVYIVYTLLTNENGSDIYRVDEEDIIMVITEDKIKNFKSNYKAQVKFKS